MYTNANSQQQPVQEPYPRPYMDTVTDSANRQIPGGQVPPASNAGVTGAPGQMPGVSGSGIYDAGGHNASRYIPPQDILTELISNKRLLTFKLFYCLYFAGFSSIFPLITVYFKQLGMNAFQAGILVGIRPLVEMFSAPFWSSFPEKHHKIMLLGSLGSFIVFTISTAFIRPPATACVIFNATHYVLYTPYSDRSDDWYEEQVIEKDQNPISPKEEPDLLGSEPSSVRSKRAPPGLAKEKPPKKQSPIARFLESIDPMYRYRPPPGHVIGKSPTSIDYTLNYNKDKHASYVSPAFSTVVYKWDDVREVFFLLLLLILLGEFFSCPAVTLADTATLNYLGERTDLYGRQRMFGSVGWAITMFFVGIALDRSTDFAGHPCGAHERERNYNVCFTYFAILMLAATGVAYKFDFDYENVQYESGPLEGPSTIGVMNDPGPKSLFNTAPPINPPPHILEQNRKKFEFIDRMKSAVFAQRTRKMPDWLTVLRHMSNVKYGSFLLVIFFMGFGIGLVFTFLFWHLQDLGGTPSLFGLASVVNHVSEIIAYFYSVDLIKELGHTRVICIGLAGNVGRFLFISWLDNPYYVLPFELLQGVTHATVWAAACSYANQAIPDPALKSSTQGVLHAVHLGIGKASGAIFGGYFISKLGTRAVFAGYGIFCLLVLAGYIYLNYTRSSEGSLKWTEDNADQVVVEGSDVLAPHGVPTAPITNRSDPKITSYHFDSSPYSNSSAQVTSRL